MTTRTGATLGNLDVIEHIEPLPRERHTYCVTDHVDNPSLRAAMSLFDDSLSDRFNDTDPGRFTVVTGSPSTGKSAWREVFIVASTRTGGVMVLPVFDIALAARPKGAIVGAAVGSVLAGNAAFGSVVGAVVGSWVGSASILAGKLQASGRSLEPVSETSAHRFDDDVVDVVRDIQHRLGVDLKDVLAAASIKPRTYHSWAQPRAPRPRLTSQGRLWALAQLVDDLPELLDVPLRQWVLADPSRLAALRTGRFDELLEQASHEGIQKDPAGNVVGSFHGVGEDGPTSSPTTNRELVVDEQAITEPAPPPSRGSPELPPA